MSNYDKCRDLPKTKAEAEARGIKQFFNGIECSNGHTASKRTSNGGCVICNRETTNRYRNRKKGITSSNTKRNRVSEIKDTGEYKEVWEE